MAKLFNVQLLLAVLIIVAYFSTISAKKRNKKDKDDKGGKGLSRRLNRLGFAPKHAKRLASNFRQRKRSNKKDDDDDDDKKKKSFRAGRRGKKFRKILRKNGFSKSFRKGFFKRGKVFRKGFFKRGRLFKTVKRSRKPLKVIHRHNSRYILRHRASKAIVYHPIRSSLRTKLVSRRLPFKSVVRSKFLSRRRPFKSFVHTKVIGGRRSLKPLIHSEVISRRGPLLHSKVIVKRPAASFFRSKVVHRRRPSFVSSKIIVKRPVKSVVRKVIKKRRPFKKVVIRSKLANRGRRFKSLVHSKRVIVRRRPLKSLVHAKRVVLHRPFKTLVHSKRVVRRRPFKSLVHSKRVVKRRPFKSLFHSKRVVRRRPFKSLVHSKKVVLRRPVDRLFRSKVISRRRPLRSFAHSKVIVRNGPGKSLARTKIFSRHHPKSFLRSKSVKTYGRSRSFKNFRKRLERRKDRDDDDDDDNASNVCRFKDGKLRTFAGQNRRVDIPCKVNLLHKTTCGHAEITISPTQSMVDKKDQGPTMAITSAWIKVTYTDSDDSFKGRLTDNSAEKFIEDDKDSPLKGKRKLEDVFDIDAKKDKVKLREKDNLFVITYQPFMPGDTESSFINFKCLDDDFDPSEDQLCGDGDDTDDEEPETFLQVFSSNLKQTSEGCEIAQDEMTSGKCDRKEGLQKKAAKLCWPLLGDNPEMTCHRRLDDDARITIFGLCVQHVCSDFNDRKSCNKLHDMIDDCPKLFKFVNKKAFDNC